jgi:hypothetical protein
MIMALIAGVDAAYWQDEGTHVDVQARGGLVMREGTPSSVKKFQGVRNLPSLSYIVLPQFISRAPCQRESAAYRAPHKDDVKNRI